MKTNRKALQKRLGELEKKVKPENPFISPPWHELDRVALSIMSPEDQALLTSAPLTHAFTVQYPETRARWEAAFREAVVRINFPYPNWEAGDVLVCTDSYRIHF